MTMTATEPVTLANLFDRTRELLREHGCTEYITVDWHRGTRRLGAAHEWFGRVHRITYSRQVMLGVSRAQMFDTMTHEVAHVLVGGSKHGHDGVWRAKHLELGGSGKVEAELTYEEGMRIHKWVGRCLGCPEVYFRERMTSQTRARGRCGKCRSRLDWHQNW